MNKKLTVIMPFYNNEAHIEAAIQSLIHQTNQDFDLIVVNDGSNDESETLLFNQLNHYNKQIQYIQHQENQGHGSARNDGMSQVQTPYFMFLDADDVLTPYAIETYLEHLNQNLTIVAPIDEFTAQPIIQRQSLNMKIQKYSLNGNERYFIDRRSVCNIIFDTTVVHQNQITFNHHSRIYSDITFLVSYMKNIDTFIQIEGIPLYYVGEIYDPFNTIRLTAQPFEYVFKDYVYSWIDALESAYNSTVRNLLLKQMLEKIRQSFEPSIMDIHERYFQLHEVLNEVIPKLKPVLKKEKKILFRLELWLIQQQYYAWSYAINRIRYSLRLFKNIAFFKPSKEYSKYKLFNTQKMVENDTILFESFGGKNYSDSPQYIYEYMKNAYPNLNYYWIFRDTQDDSIPKDVQSIRKGSRQYYHVFKKARVWVSNARLPLFIEKKSNQLYIQTWHGTPLKRLANDMKTVRLPNTTTALYKRNFYLATKRWDYLISPNRYSTEIFQSAFWMNPTQILEVGYPRNDILVNHKDDLNLQRQLKRELNIPDDKKVILYAPTWRDDEYEAAGHYTFELKIDLSRLQQALGDDYVILLRMHYLIANALDLHEYEDFAIDVSHYNDISKLYLISDALITDYSSVMFDYGILKRPQFFFAYDIKKYDKDLRGFYIDYHKDLPGPIYTDSDALIEGLKQMDLIAQTYEQKIEAFYQRFCSLEKGNASQFIGDMIYRETQKS